MDDEQKVIRIVGPEDPPAPVAHGIEVLLQALDQRGYAVVASTATTELARCDCVIAIGPAAQGHSRVEPPEQAESAVIAKGRYEGVPAIFLLGADATGLMYALLECAAQITAHGIDHVRPQVESPATPVRGIFTFLHNARLEEEWFYSPEYWHRYFGWLAHCRFNSFNLVFAHQTNYLAPMFPFFIAVPEHPEVQVPGLTEAQRERNLTTLQSITQLAASRGIRFVLGIWQLCAWRAGHFIGSSRTW